MYECANENNDDNFGSYFVSLAENNKPLLSSVSDSALEISLRFSL